MFKSWTSRKASNSHKPDAIPLLNICKVLIFWHLFFLVFELFAFPVDIFIHKRNVKFNELIQSPRSSLVEFGPFIRQKLKSTICFCVYINIVDPPNIIQILSWTTLDKMNHETWHLWPIQIMHTVECVVYYYSYGKKHHTPNVEHFSTFDI